MTSTYPTHTEMKPGGALRLLIR